MEFISGKAVNHPRLKHLLVPDYEEVFLRQLSEGCIRIWQRIASMERILRNDRPRGVMPEVLTARPRGRGISQYFRD